MLMDDRPCAANASACCCAGHSTIPCVQNASSKQQRCASFASGHLLSRTSYGYGVYESAIQFSGAEGAISFWDIGEHELCGGPHEETQFYYTGGAAEAKTIKTGYYTPTAHAKDGSVGHPLKFDLAFNPSMAEHIYRIEWQPGFIAWSIDGVLLRNATAGIPTPRPTEPGKPPQPPPSAGDCAKIKFILHPGHGGVHGQTQNRVRYLSYNKSSFYS
eukprot:SAG22_NODE_1413_length_4476_cov_2.231894_2_plen_216_part_00